MKKVIIIVIAVLLGGFAGYLLRNPETIRRAWDQGIGGYYFDDVEQTVATTTADTNPIQVLSTKTSRQYALIQNDSDTSVYLALGASTTAAVNEGIRLNANGGSYEINELNLYTGEIWATSSASNKKLLITEK